MKGQLTNSLLKGRKLQTLVENQTTFTVNNAALHVFETHQQAERVLLEFDQPVLASMIEGKKVMHLRDYESFQFLPGESLILPAKELMCIDFPEAEVRNPTRCLAMAISEDKINEVLEWMNRAMPKDEGSHWGLMDYNFHFVNDSIIYQIIQRLMFLFAEDHAYKDLFVDNMLRELIIRVMQTNERAIYSAQTISLRENSRLAYVVRFIRENLQETLNVDALSKQACMSPSHFYRTFKSELGISPIEFINAERIKQAVSLLQNPDISVKEVYLSCGFESRSYFNRVFKNHFQVSPGAYKELHQNTAN
jgi:AraC family transcriptional regulator